MPIRVEPRVEWENSLSPTMCEFNPDCSLTPGVVVTVGPGESVLDCCGVVVGSSLVTSENGAASP